MDQHPAADPETSAASLVEARDHAERLCRAYMALSPIVQPEPAPPREGWLARDAEGQPRTDVEKAAIVAFIMTLVVLAGAFLLLVLRCMPSMGGPL